MNSQSDLKVPHSKTAETVFLIFLKKRWLNTSILQEVTTQLKCHFTEYELQCISSAYKQFHIILWPLSKVASSTTEPA